MRINGYNNPYYTPQITRKSKPNKSQDEYDRNKDRDADELIIAWTSKIKLRP